MKSQRRTMKWVKIIAVPVAPAIFGLLYMPINRVFVVKILGCGCTDGFNTNSFNGILFGSVFVVSIGLLVWASWRLPRLKQWIYLVCGLIVQALSCYFAWKDSLWR